MKKFKNIMEVLAFILVFAILFSRVSFTLQRKGLVKPLDMTTKIRGFYNEKEDQFDVLFLSTSQAYCSFIPALFYEDQGVRSYIFATQQQPMSATYHYMKEVLKTQKPKLIVLDILVMVYDRSSKDDGVLHSATDDIPLSWNKIAMVYDTAPKGKRGENLFNIIKYHGRWSELQDVDYETRKKDLHDTLKGYMILDKVLEDAPEIPLLGPDERIEPQPIKEEDEKYLLKIIELAEEENIDLLFVKTPTLDFPNYQGKVEYTKALLKDHGIPFLDFNREEKIESITKEDFSDLRHLNKVGAAKFSRVFGQYLAPYGQAKKDPIWDQAIKDYYREYEEGHS